MMNKVGRSSRANLTQTPFMSVRTTLLASLIISVLAYYLYTRENFDFLSNRESGKRSTSVHDEHMHQSGKAHDQHSQHLDRSSAISELYAWLIKGRPAEQFIKGETDLIVLICFVLGMIVSILVIQRRNYLRERAREKSLVKNARLFAEPISLNEFQEQAKYCTKFELQKLYKSQEYQQMQAQKGNQVGNWNWQMREHKTMEEITEENDYLNNVEAISHIDEKSRCEGGKFNSNFNIYGGISTKDSSENGIDQANSKIFRQNRYFLRSSSIKKSEDLDLDY